MNPESNIKLEPPPDPPGDHAAQPSDTGGAVSYRTFNNIDGARAGGGVIGNVDVIPMLSLSSSADSSTHNVRDTASTLSTQQSQSMEPPASTLIDFDMSGTFDTKNQMDEYIKQYAAAVGFISKDKRKEFSWKISM